MADWKQVREIFEQLVALPPAERAAALRAATGEDVALMREVQRLLDADADSVADARLPPAPAEWLVRSLGDAESGQHIDRWRLLQPLGQGGMGSVWLAERHDVGFTQRAALKRIRGIGMSPAARARFAAEQRILARLSHPHIAGLIDGGIDEAGQPFLAIEYVEGLPLTEYVDRAALDLTAILRLFLDVCAAVAHAHQQLVIHRDLKPSNILVDQAGRVKLLDFGIAKLLDEFDAPQIGLTATGVRLYTPGYAAPEQLRGNPVGTTTDVFALGVLLYELVSGRRPFEVPSLSPIDWERALLTEEPPPPSRRPADGVHRPEVPRSWRADLDAIVLKALRRDASERYPTVDALVTDLQALQAGLPVAARRGSRRDRFYKFLRRHALAVGAGSVAILALLTGLGVALWQAERAATERDNARREALTAERSLRFLTRVFELADPGEARGATVTARDLLDRGARSISSELREEPEVRARLQITLGDAYGGLGLAPQALELAQSAWRDAAGSQDPLLQARALLSLASAEIRRGLEDQAEAHLREGLALALPAESAAEAVRADLELSLATLLAGATRLDEAQPWFESGLARQRRALGAIDPGVVTPYSSYLHARGRVGEAETLLLEALERVRRERTEDDPLRAGLAAQLATNLVRQGRAQEAIPLQQEALDAKRKIYGDTHPSVDLTRHNLAKSLSDLGRWPEAEALLTELLPRSRERNGEAHPRTAASEAALARVYLETDRPALALPLWDQALATALAQWGEADTAVGIVRLGRGQTLAALGRATEARAELDRAIATYTTIGKGGRGGLARSLSERARVLLALGDPAAACADADAGLQTLPQADGLAGAFAQAVRAECLQQQGQTDAARTALDAATEALGTGHPESLLEVRYLRSLRARFG